MYKTQRRVVCYLRVITLIRKNDNVPSHLDRERFEEIFRQVREHPEKAQSKRVEGVLELLSRLRHDLSGSAKVRIITGLRHLLSVYQWVVQVSPTTEGFRALHLIADRGRLSRDDLWEHTAIRDLLDVVPYLGERPRIRRCADATCWRWFFAKTERKTHKFCSTNCRVNVYDSSSTRRAEKKVYMRQYRQGLKERDDRDKKRVGFGRSPKRRATTGART
jgi:hypothetical protein